MDFCSKRILPRRMEELIFLLYVRGAIAFGEFDLRVHREHPDAPKSPIYFNLRSGLKGPLSQRDINQIGRAFYGMASRHNVWADYVVGVPEGSNPIARAFARSASRHKRTIDLCVLEKGTNTIVEGELVRGKSVLVLEDVITQGTSSLKTVEALRDRYGLRVVALIACIDREQGGVAALTSALVSSYVLMSTPQILDFLAFNGFIGESTRKNILDYPMQLVNFFLQKQISH